MAGDGTREWAARPNASSGRAAPRPVRVTLWLVLAVMLAGALYLYAVRGEALILDLAAIGRFLLCL